LEWQKLTRDRFRSPLAAVLREHRKRALADGFDGGDHFVFSTRSGTPISHRNVAAPSRTRATSDSASGVIRWSHTRGRSLALVRIVRPRLTIGA
jgi:hypothetical protein